MKVGIFAFLVCSLNAGAVQVSELESTPFNNNMKIDFHTNNEVLSRNNPLYFQLTSFPLGLSTYSEKLQGIKKNVFGTSVVMFFNGEKRVYLRKIDSKQMPSKAKYFEKIFCKYLPTIVAKELPEGKNCVTVAAINSYGETIKRDVGITTRIIDYSKRVPRNRNLEEKIDKPYILYNEPYGDFMKGEPILLDFISLNTKLSPKGNKVLVKIDGELVATITKSAPYKITNLPRGEHVIKLELVDSKGSHYPLPFKPQQETIRVE